MFGKASCLVRIGGVQNEQEENEEHEGQEDQEQQEQQEELDDKEEQQEQDEREGMEETCAKATVPTLLGEALCSKEDGVGQCTRTGE